MSENRRVLSSRDSSNDLRLVRLFELLFLLRDALGLPHQDFPDNEDVLIDAIGESVVNLALAYSDEQDEVTRLTMEVLNHAITNTMLEAAAERRQRALEVLCAPPVGHKKQFSEALKFFLSTPGIKTTVDSNGILQYQLDSDTLTEALQGGIEMYNLDHVTDMKF